MIFLLDENIAPSLAGILQQWNYSAVHARELNLTGKTDANIFDYAAENNYIIITHDLDFSRIHALSGKAKPSVILFRLEPLTVKMMSDILSKHLHELTADLQAGAFVVVEEDQIRIRPLPIKAI